MKLHRKNEEKKPFLEKQTVNNNNEKFSLTKSLEETLFRVFFLMESQSRHGHKVCMFQRKLPIYERFFISPEENATRSELPVVRISDIMSLPNIPDRITRRCKNVFNTSCVHPQATRQLKSYRENILVFLYRKQATMYDVGECTLAASLNGTDEEVVTAVRINAKNIKLLEGFGVVETKTRTGECREGRFMEQETIGFFFRIW